MYKVNEEEILKQELLADLVVAYSNFECIYKSCDLTIYLEFFYQVYYWIRNYNLSPGEFSIQYIGRFESFDKKMLNVLCFMIQTTVKKYGIRMDRIKCDGSIFIQFNKIINKKVYYVDNIIDLQRVKNSLVL